MQLKALFLLVVTSLTIQSLVAFTAPGRALGGRTDVQKSFQYQPSSRSKTDLQAIMLPPMIISPIIKKMREENKKKNQPMTDQNEAAGEAAGLRVGRSAWKWPAIWPYQEDFFLTKFVEDQKSTGPDINEMASMLSGVASPPPAPKEEVEVNEFEPIKFWREADTSTPLDPEAAEKLRDHYAFYMEEGMSVLEFGAAENSYLPANIKLSRHVGVGANLDAMNKNPSITSTLEVDLNKVVPDRDVDSDDLRRLAQEELFDVVLMHNVVPFLTHPRETFRSAWYLLKPGGRMIVSFLSREATKSAFPEAQVKLWRDYNDDQHLWMTGSFFQFSAGDGWEDLLAFDISPDSAKDMDSGTTNPIANFFKGKANNVFVVQAVKGFQDEEVDPDNLERSIRSLCWMMPVLEDRDKSLVVPRLARAYAMAQNLETQEAIERNIPLLPKIYEVLIKMDQFAFTFSMQAQLAADLVTNPDFNANGEQIVSLKRGLGLMTPDEAFWGPVGSLTAAMQAEDKINLLGYIVPCFGSNNSAQEEALEAFVSGLEPTFKVIRSKCPEMSESDVQLIGTEFLANEILKPGLSTRDEYARWLSAMSSQDIEDLVQERKAIVQNSKKELIAYKEARAEELRRREEYKQKMEEQMQNARMTRTMIFNPRTEKMEMFENPNLKKD